MFVSFVVYLCYSGKEKLTARDNRVSNRVASCNDEEEKVKLDIKTRLCFICILIYQASQINRAIECSNTY